MARPPEATPTSVIDGREGRPGRASKVTSTGSPSRTWAMKTSGIATCTSGRLPEVSTTAVCPTETFSLTSTATAEMAPSRGESSRV